VTGLLTGDERQAVADHFASLREAVSEGQALTSAQLATLDRRLGEIEGAARRLTRKDFVVYAVGSVLTIVMELALESSLASEIFRSTVEFVSQLFSGFAELPPAPRA
jgi:hypothetical protein